MFSTRARILRHLHSNSSALLFSKPALHRFPCKMSEVARPGTGTPSAPVRMIQTAACLVIGDEVLNGKIVDTNSPFFAKYCFSLGLDLKRVEVIPDDEADIIEAVRRMSEKYDFIVTSGGIGPTHDDITYHSIAKAFNVPLEVHDETRQRMRRLWKSKRNEASFDWDTPSPRLSAKLRMATLPTGTGCRAYFPSDELWVPIAIVNENIHILPGIPLLFQEMLTGLEKELVPRIEASNRNIFRMMISTPQPESQMADYLTELQNKVQDRGVKVGSYPRWGKPRNTVTLVGRDREYIEGLEAEVLKQLEGTRISVEGEDDSETDETIQGV
ncbi:hypothetical protein TWF730_001213 [Orbilia blumenaviensis]|uniref:MoaB/Mog domain-containing protein n=1 Tax=Orbilia blumenaviensis TaxID=1796055 RepID=A0AAV9VR37_9PEZI